MVSVDSPSPAPGIGSKALIGLAGLAAIVFIVVAALPYRARPSRTFSSRTGRAAGGCWFIFSGA
jgi:hypothetical protein